jgi:hypothetical protein
MRMEKALSLEKSVGGSGVECSDAIFILYS